MDQKTPEDSAAPYRRGAHPVMVAAGALDRGVARLESFILAYGVLAMFVNTISNVIGRFVFGQSLYFTEELNQFLIVLVTFVGLGYATRNGRHIRMSAFYDTLGDRPRKLLMIAISLSTGCIMLWLGWLSVGYIHSVATSGKVTSALRVPLYLTYLWVPLGFFITGLQYMLAVLRNLQSPGIWLSWQQIDEYDENDELEMAKGGEDRA